MATGNFERCHAVTAKWEGGWSNHAADPGGKTMYGITEGTYHAWLRARGRAIKPVRGITMDEAKEIYRQNFWNPVSGDTLAAGVDLATYDAGVNSGVSRGKKWLAASLGGTPAQTVKRICAKRLGFMQSLKIWKTFGKGWGRRVADIEAKGVAWALSGAGKSQQAAKAELQMEAAAAEKAAKRQATGAAASGTTAGGGTVVGPEAADQLGGLALAGMIGLLVAIALLLIWRARLNKARSEAYASEARATA